MMLVPIARIVECGSRLDDAFVYMLTCFSDGGVDSVYFNANNCDLFQSLQMRDGMARY